MKTFTVYIVETITYRRYIEAKSKAEAERIAHEEANEGNGLNTCTDSQIEVKAN